MVRVLLKLITNLTAKLCKLEIQKCGQILCAHKPYFLMLGHILHVHQINLKCGIHHIVYNIAIRIYTAV